MDNKKNRKIINKHNKISKHKKHLNIFLLNFRLCRWNLTYHKSIRKDYNLVENIDLFNLLGEKSFIDKLKLIKNIIYPSGFYDYKIGHKIFNLYNTYYTVSGKCINTTYWQRKFLKIDLKCFKQIINLKKLIYYAYKELIPSKEWYDKNIEECDKYKYNLSDDILEDYESIINKEFKDNKNILQDNIFLLPSGIYIYLEVDEMPLAKEENNRLENNSNYTLEIQIDLKINYILSKKYSQDFITTSQSGYIIHKPKKIII